MKITHTKIAALFAASALALLGACGSDEATPASNGKDTKDTAEVDTGGPTEVGGSLDIIGKSLSSVMSQKIESYEVEGNTVRLKVRSGITLAGSECIIIDSATGSDYPDATFVLVQNGKETKC